MSAKLEVTIESKTLTTNESYVVVKTTSGNIELIVDNKYMSNNKLLVDVLARYSDDTAYVILPAQPLWGPKGVVVEQRFLS